MNNSNNIIDNSVKLNQTVNKPSIDEKVISKEANSMKCKKVSIMDAIGHDVFLENYGIATISIYNYYFNVGNNQQIQLNQLYKATTADYFDPLNSNGENVIRNESWDSEKYYMKDPNKRNNGYYDYGYNSSLIKGQEKEVKIKSLSITFYIKYQTSFGRMRTTGKEYLTLEFKNKKEMNDYTVWYLKVLMKKN